MAKKSDVYSCRESLLSGNRQDKFCTVVSDVSSFVGNFVLSRSSVTGVMLGRKMSVVGEHSLLLTDFGEEAGVEIEERDWMNK